jgi:FkbM family methyltransferase
MKVSTYWSHTFLPEWIRQDGVAFDFGVNEGGFSRLMAPLCAQVIGFEPDPSWTGRHQLPENVVVHAQALSAQHGPLQFHVNKERCSSLHYAESGTETVKVTAVTLEEALSLAPDRSIEIIKMDIEGEELAVLKEAPAALFGRVSQMTVEFHDFLDPTSVPAIREVIQRMKSLGFMAFKMSWRSYGDLLFVNRQRIKLSWWQRLSLILFHKYGSGLVRMLRRTFGGQRVA